MTVEEGANQIKDGASKAEILFILAVSVFLVMLAQYHWKRRRMYRMAAKIPGPPSYPIVGSGLMFIGSTEKILLTVKKLMDSYQSPVKVWLGPDLCFVTSIPEHYDIVFNHPQCLGKHCSYKYGSSVVGEGLFSAPLEKWKRNRKIISPAFNQKILNNFVPVFMEQVTVLGNILEKNVGRLIDISHFIDKYSLDVTCETSMGVKMNAQITEAEFGTYVERLLSIFYQRMFQIWYYPDIIFYNSPIGREFTEKLKQFFEYTDKVINKKKEEYFKQKEWAKQFPEAETDESKNMKNFLDLLLELTEDDQFTNEELRDEVNTFIIAGADTTTSSISFCILMLGMHPEYQEKLYEEVIDVTGHDRAIEYSDLSHLKFTERFIQETNRLFPIGPLVARENKDDVDLGDCVLPAGSSSILFILHTHRSPKYWPNPLVFNPDRFLPEETAKRHPCAYVPFTAGPRACIGKRYAMMMLKTTLAHIVKKFKITTPYRQVKDVRLKQDLILKAAEGYKVKLTLRN